MTKGQDKVKGKKKELVKEVNKESEEKWKGLENKVWTVAEFGYYVILIAFTIFAIGFRSSELMNGSSRYIDDTSSRYITNQFDTFYYNVANQCSDLDNCLVKTEANFQNKVVDIYYNSLNGCGILEIGEAEISVGSISEFAMLKNGYIATFTTNSGNNLISYYDSQGNLVREFVTTLDSSGKLDSDVGIYAVCNNGKIETVKYSLKSDGNFDEELVGTYSSNQC